MSRTLDAFSVAIGDIASDAVVGKAAEDDLTNALQDYNAAVTDYNTNHPLPAVQMVPIGSSADLFLMVINMIIAAQAEATTLEETVTTLADVYTMLEGQFGE